MVARSDGVEIPSQMIPVDSRVEEGVQVTNGNVRTDRYWYV